MRKHRSRIIGLGLVGAMAALMTACDQEPAAPFDDVATATAENLSATIQVPAVTIQRDRMAIPAVNTAFIASGADKDAFNFGIPGTDVANFRDIVIATSMARYGLDATQAGIIADIVLPDALPLGDLSGFPAGGRGLRDDVIDAELMLLFGIVGPAVPALQSDNVDGNDKDFLDRFPYLAGPHTGVR